MTVCLASWVFGASTVGGLLAIPICIFIVLARAH